jgi:hypothetical protein
MKEAPRRIRRWTVPLSAAGVGLAVCLWFAGAGMAGTRHPLEIMPAEGPPVDNETMAGGRASPCRTGALPAC